MNFEKLLDFVNLEDKRLRNLYGNYPDEEKRILARMVKLTEEVGELSEEVLSHLKLQRKEKIQSNKNELSNEFADVIITTLLLAKSLRVDIKEALNDKIKIINERY